ncbi:hypothetical protein [Roseovarius aestuariivivens]|uniref:hypothetical protein n=1 Tax=Roseovarius aestuariivivens TaxID=1888910 RepID=UPI00107FDF4A|nr:hypothetical protein [Roseovarius aestuariivivens]
MLTRRALVVLLVVGLAAIAANMPRAWIFGQSIEERTSEVLSDFINLGSDPPESPIKADWLVRNERLRLLRQERLEHIPPALLSVHADAEGMTPEAFRGRLIDPQRDDPFETTTAPLQLPKGAPHGQVAGFFWAHVKSGTETSNGDDAACENWLVVWDMEHWFYAPVGTSAFNGLLATALPELADVPLALKEGCESDA